VATSGERLCIDRGESIHGDTAGLHISRKNVDAKSVSTPRNVEPSSGAGRVSERRMRAARAAMHA